MASVKVGGRVGAVSHKKDGKVYLFGYGTYEGDFRLEGEGVFGSADEIEKEIRDQAIQMKKACEDNKLDFNLTEDDIQKTVDRFTKNPRIKLDNGDVVWGAQCWWGPEEQVKNAIEGQEVIIVPVPSKAAVAQSEERDSPKV